MKIQGKKMTEEQARALSAKTEIVRARFVDACRRFLSGEAPDRYGKYIGDYPPAARAVLEQQYSGVGGGITP